MANDMEKSATLAAIRKRIEKEKQSNGGKLLSSDGKEISPDDEDGFAKSWADQSINPGPRKGTK